MRERGGLAFASYHDYWPMFPPKRNIAAMSGLSVRPWDFACGLCGWRRS